MALKDYVRGDVSAVRAWLSGSAPVRERLLGNSQTEQEGHLMGRLSPRRFGGAFCYATDMLDFVTALNYGTTVSAGFGTAGYLTGNYAPHRVREIKWNGGVSGWGGTLFVADRLFDVATPMTAGRTTPGSGAAWGNDWDWLKGRLGYIRGYYVGTGNDGGSFKQLARNPAAAFLGASGTVPGGPLGTVIAVDTPISAPAVNLTTADDVYGAMMFDSAAAPAVNSLRSVIGFTIETDDTGAGVGGAAGLDPRGHYRVWNEGIASMRLSDFQDPNRYNQDGRAKLSQLAMDTDIEEMWGENEKFYDSIPDSEAWDALLEVEYALYRRYNPNVRFRIVSPPLAVEGYRTYFDRLHAGNVSFAERHRNEGVYYVDLRGYFNNPAAFAPYTVGAGDPHRTAEGKVLVRQAMIQSMHEYAVSSAAGVNVVEWGGRPVADTPQPGVVLLTVAASGSTGSRVFVDEPYDSDNTPRYVGNWLYVDGQMTFVNAYGDGPSVGGPSGSAYLDVVGIRAPLEPAPAAGSTVYIMPATTDYVLNGAPVPFQGGGDVAVNHNGGTGVTVDGAASEPDILLIEDDGTPIDDAEIIAYTAADFAAGRTGTVFRQGTARTGADGRWVQPIMLNAGSYVFVVRAVGMQTRTAEIVVS